MTHLFVPKFGRPSRRPPVVVLQYPAKALPIYDGARLISGFLPWLDQLVAQPLVIAFHVVMFQKSGKRVEQRPFRNSAEIDALHPAGTPRPNSMLKVPVLAKLQDLVSRIIHDFRGVDNDIRHDQASVAVQIEPRASANR